MMETDKGPTKPFDKRKSLGSGLRRFYRHTGGNVTVEFTLLIMLVGITMAGALSMVANSSVNQTIADMREILAPVAGDAPVLADDQELRDVDDTILTGSTTNSGEKGVQ